jgi:hypothetical protein
MGNTLPASQPPLTCKRKYSACKYFGPVKKLVELTDGPILCTYGDKGWVVKADDKTT